MKHVSNPRIRVWSQEEGYHFQCKDCEAFGGPFKTRSKRESAIAAHTTEVCRAIQKEKAETNSRVGS